MSEPNQKHPQQPLDSVLAESGPMPAARLGIRALAFFVDWALISLAASLIIWNFFISREYPEAYNELTAWFSDLITWFREGGLQEGTPRPIWSESLAEAMAYGNILMFLTFWIYFAISEAFFGGKSIGKSFCRLRSISIVTLEKPSFITAVIRSGMKAFALLIPYAMFATLIVLMFNKRKQTGHDFLTRTAVIDEKYTCTVVNES